MIGYLLCLCKIDIDEFMYELAIEIRKMEEKGKVITASLDLPKSMVVTTEYVYITPVSPQTLEKRFKMWQAGRKD